MSGTLKREMGVCVAAMGIGLVPALTYLVVANSYR